MRIKLTPRETDILVTLVSDEVTIKRTPELDELLGGKTRTYEGTIQNGIMILGEEIAKPVA